MERLRINKYCVFSFYVGGISTELSSVGSSLESVIDIELIIINSVRHGRHSLSVTYTFTCKVRLQQTLKSKKVAQPELSIRARNYNASLKLRKT